MSVKERNISLKLIKTLRELGDNYGPLGVALAAASLTDKDVLIDKLIEEMNDER